MINIIEDKEYYGIIYEAINKINGKKYIGQTKNDLIIRQRQHFSDSSKNDNLHFHNAIRKYGRENFEWHIIDHSSNEEELDLKEIFWIEFLKTYDEKFGYNMTFGGQTIKEGSFYRKSNDLRLRYDTNILIYDMNGNYFATTNAENIYNVIGSYNSTLMLKVLHGEKPSVNNYFLFYEDEFTEDKLKDCMKRKRFNRDFALFTIEKECIGVWNNLLQCSKEQSLASHRGIQLQLNTQPKQHPRRYICKFIDDLDEELKESLNTYLNRKNIAI